ncbi:PLP-dependent cysteine synthase family protein [Streptomyces sp. NPDC003233]
MSTTVPRTTSERSSGDLLVGDTPLVELPVIGRGLRHRLLAKCEFMNPTGSVKDRSALNMIEGAEAEGLITPGRSTLVEATGGNTGVSLAIIGARRGYRVVCTMSDKMGPEKIRYMETAGAEVVLAPYGLPFGHEGTYLSIAQRLGKEPDHYFVNQFGNTYNELAHYTRTGPEIWRQTEGAVDAVVGGAGTGGTLSGIGRYLREHKPKVRSVLADPVGSVLGAAVPGRTATAAPYLVEGVGGDWVPPFVTRESFHEVETIPDPESARMTLRLLREEGLFVGPPSGLAVAAAVRYIERLPGEGKTVVVILTDGGNRYTSTWFDPKWRKDKGLEAD